MAWQFIIVGAIIFSALMLTCVRLFHFFTVPPSKCHGCSGCKLEELKVNRRK